MSYLPELRSALVRAADRQREAAAPQGAGLRGWSRAGLRAIPVAVGIAVAAAVAIVALTAFGHHPTTPQTPAGHGHYAPGPNPPPPQFSVQDPADIRLIQAASRATVKRDPACSTSIRALPAVATGTPPSSLTSALGVLRRPATAADRLLGSFTGPGNELGPSVREVYVNYIRRLYVAFGTSYYVIPAGNVTGFRRVPGRCASEQVAALRRMLARSSRKRRDRALRDQASYLRWEHYRAAHPAGVCSADVTLSGGGSSSESIGCAYTVAEIDQGAAEGWEGSAPRGVFAGLVPDGVAAVAVHYPTANSTPLSVRVKNNSFVFRSLHLPSTVIPTITWLDARGRTIRTIRGVGG